MRKEGKPLASHPSISRRVGMLARGRNLVRLRRKKHRPVANVAVARELAALLWEAMQTRPAPPLARAA